MLCVCMYSHPRSCQAHPTTRLVDDRSFFAGHHILTMDLSTAPPASISNSPCQLPHLHRASQPSHQASAPSLALDQLQSLPSSLTNLIRLPTHPSVIPLPTLSSIPTVSRSIDLSTPSIALCYLYFSNLKLDSTSSSVGWRVGSPPELLLGNVLLTFAWIRNDVECFECVATRTYSIDKLGHLVDMQLGHHPSVTGPLLTHFQDPRAAKLDMVPICCHANGPPNTCLQKEAISDSNHPTLVHSIRSGHNPHSSISLVNHLVVSTCPGTVFPVTKLSQNLQKLGLAHWNSVIHLLCYLSSTKKKKAGHHSWQGSIQHHLHGHWLHQLSRYLLLILHIDFPAWVLWSIPENQGNNRTSQPSPQKMRTRICITVYKKQSEYVFYLQFSTTHSTGNQTS